MSLTTWLTCPLRLGIRSVQSSVQNIEYVGSLFEMAMVMIHPDYIQYSTSTTCSYVDFHHICLALIFAVDLFPGGTPLKAM